MESEVKILEIDRKGVERRLASLGATKSFDGNIGSVFFDYPDNSIREGGNLLRLRHTDKKAFLTFKKFVEISSVKSMEEYEVEVCDFEKMRLILKSLGLLVTKELKKHRTSYALGGVHFDIDKYSGEYSHIPEFMEIEAEDAATVYKYAEILGFDADDCKPWTTNDLMNYYSEEKGKKGK